MKREFNSLEERKAFERMFLPDGRKAIGVRWTYDYKYNPDGSIIVGKEKARLVAQGFSQRPEDMVKRMHLSLNSLVSESS